MQLGLTLEHTSKSAGLEIERVLQWRSFHATCKKFARSVPCEYFGFKEDNPLLYLTSSSSAYLPPYLWQGGAAAKRIELAGLSYNLMFHYRSFADLEIPFSTNLSAFCT